ERVAELGAGGDAELREQAVQVRSDRAVREVQALADLAVREPLCRQLADLQLLRGQLRPRTRVAASRRLAGRAQLTERALCEAEQAKSLARLCGLEPRSARFGHSVMPPEPGAVRELGARHEVRP